MNKKIKFLIVILILILLVIILRSTYSKYIGEAAGDVKVNVGKWTIKINTVGMNENRGSGYKYNFDIIGDYFVWDNSSNRYSNYVRDNKIVPGMNGVFKIEIDPSDTDVSFNYTITIDVTDLETTNFQIGSIALENGKTCTVEETTVDVAGVQRTLKTCKRLKPLTEINSADDNEKKDVLDVEISWPDNIGQDEKDTLIGRAAKGIDDVKIPVTVNAIQYTGEE